MVKSMMVVHENLDISNFPKLTAFIKKLNVGHHPTQSKVLTKEEVDRFMIEAPTNQYLLIKVIALLGIAGGCRREEIYNLTMDNVEDTGTQLVVHIEQTKTNIRRVFTVINGDGVLYLDIFRQYYNLRKDIPGKPLLLNYRQGKCVSQRAGIHTVGGAPKKIAEFLKLEHPEKYTGHCFRRTSSTFLANAGADISILKRHGGWKSNTVAEKYVEESIENKTKIARMIQGGETFVQVLQQNQSTSASTKEKEEASSLIISGNSNCTINVTIQKCEDSLM